MFVAFEGIDGCGKSTQARRLVLSLQARGLVVRHVREPGGTPLGERLRDVLLHRGEVGISPRSEALLYSTARCELVETELRPALSRGETVVCERYFWSTLAYQGHGLGLDVVELERLSRFATAGLLPEFVILLDLPAARAVARLGAERDRIEARGEAYLERVREGFLALAAGEPSRFVVIDAAPGVDAVEWSVAEALRRAFP